MQNYRRSIIFSNIGMTAQQLELDAILLNYKQKLKINSLSKSRLSNKQTTQVMKSSQAKVIQLLSARVKKTSFNTIYKNFQKQGRKQDNINLNDPQKMQLFRKGKYYQYNYKIQKDDNNLDSNIMQYFERTPAQQQIKVIEAPRMPSQCRTRSTLYSKRSSALSLRSKHQ